MRTVNCENWLSWRMKGIGGSDAGGVMNVLPWLDPFKLWAIKTGRLPSGGPLSSAMARGNELEPVARAAYEKMTGIPMTVVRGEHQSWPLFRASFDGLNFDADRCLEIKCPGDTDHQVALRGDIPPKYIWQCVHLCLVAGVPYCDYFSYRPESPEPMKLITFERNLKLEKELIREERRFWKYVVDDVCPPREEPTYVDDRKVFKLKKRSGK